MKILKTFSFALLLLSSGLIYATVVPATVISSDIPAKTVIIKHPDAADLNHFFSTATSINFEVYKAGSKADVAAIINSIKSNKAIKDCVMGTSNGDYQSFTINLNLAQNKTWYINMFKNAGLRTIRVNNDPIVEVDKL